MRCPTRPRATTVAHQRYTGFVAAVLGLLVVALAALLLGTSLHAGALVTSPAPPQATAQSAREPADAAADLANRAEDSAASATTNDASVTGVEAGTNDPGLLVRMQVAPSLRAIARPGPEGRLLAVVLAGLLLAIIGRRPTARRPVLIPLPASAAPGLGLRRRGPPLR